MELGYNTKPLIKRLLSKRECTTDEMRLHGRRKYKEGFLFIFV